MNTTTKTLVVAVSAAVVIVVLAGTWQVRQAAQAAAVERAELAAAQAEREAARVRWQARLTQIEKERQELQVALADARKSAGAAAASAKPVVASASAAAPAPAPVASGGPGKLAELLAQDPRLQVLFLEARRAEFATKYGPLAAALGLAPGKIDQLAAAQTKWQEQIDDLTTIVRERKLPANDPSVTELKKQADEALKAEQLAVLGAAGYEQLRDYRTTLSAREIVGRFAGAAALGDVPLNTAQADQLTRIMAAAAGGARRGGESDTSRVDWALVDAQAQALLTPAQLALFQRIEPAGGGYSRWMARFQSDGARRGAAAEVKKSDYFGLAGPRALFCNFVCRRGVFGAQPIIPTRL